MSNKLQFSTNEYVVYPAHGVGQIVSVEEQEIAGASLELYVIVFEKDKMTLRVPTNKAEEIGMRSLSSPDVVTQALTTLKGKPKVKRAMWSRRAQEYEQKITSGKIYELAEVVRDLNKGDDIMIDQSYSERQLFEKAYERILTEFQIILNLTLEDTQKKLDKALKRNLEKSQQNLEKKGQTNPQSTQDTEEPENLENVSEEE